MTNEIGKSYDYITDIPLFNLTQEKIDELNDKYLNKEKELQIVMETSEIDKWIAELDEFVQKYNEWTKLHSNLDKKKSTSLIKKKVAPISETLDKVSKSKTTSVVKPKTKAK